jgi:hypothetical protein
MYQQFLLDEWRRRNMRHAPKDLYAQNESTTEYDDESGTGSDEEFEYDDEDDSDVDKAIVNQMMVETSRSEPNSDSESSSDLEFEDEERKSPDYVRRYSEEVKSSTATEEENSSLNSSNTSSQYSSRAIEFDENDIIIEKKTSKKNLQLEMVNLKE